MIHKLTVVSKQDTAMDRVQLYVREGGESLGWLNETTRTKYFSVFPLSSPVK